METNWETGVSVQLIWQTVRGYHWKNPGNVPVSGGGGRGLGPVKLRGGQRIIECIFHKVKYFRGEKPTSRGNDSIIQKMI